MKERSIRFSAPEVRAILDVTKTQTRRVLNPQPEWENRGIPGVTDAIIKWRVPPVSASPYGQPGDRLWVRETTRMRHMANFLTGEPIPARCGEYLDGEFVLSPEGFDFVWWYSRNTCPSIHMPRWASRITLEIVSVRVERLQDISEEDAKAEGAEPVLVPPDGGSCPHRQGFLDLWESINGAGSWEANPWVWCVEFKNISQKVVAKDCDG